MILYQSSLQQFKEDVLLNVMLSLLLETMRKKGLSGGSPGEAN